MYIEGNMRKPQYSVKNSR